MHTIETIRGNNINEQQQSLEARSHARNWEELLMVDNEIKHQVATGWV
jgi:hypothetical protein